MLTINLSSVIPLACTACIDIQFLYRFPHAWAAIIVVLIWFGVDAWRTTAESFKTRRVLTFWGIVLSMVWFTFCMMPVAWGSLLGAVTGFIALNSTLRKEVAANRRYFSAICFVALSLIAGLSVWKASRIEHQIAWIGKLPTHSYENQHQVRFIRAGGEQAEAIVRQAAQQRLADNAHSSWYGLGSLAREISRIDAPQTCQLMTMFYDRLIQDLAKNEYLSAGQPAAILACGQSACPSVAGRFGEQAEIRLDKQDFYGTLIFLTALGLANRDAAIQWRDSHDMAWLDNTNGSRREDRTLHSIWAEIQTGTVDKARLQKRIDTFTPACGPYVD